MVQIDPKLKKVLESIIRASQANQDHLSGEAKEFARKFNQLGNDVSSLFELLGIEYKNESNEESGPDSFGKPRAIVELSDDTPEPLGTAAPGDDDEASRDDHVHAHGALSAPSSAHDADDIDFAPAAGIAATDVQAAIVEDAGDLAAHLADTSDAHDASAISIVDTGGFYTGTDVEAALQEIEGGGGGAGGFKFPFFIS